MINLINLPSFRTVTNIQSFVYRDSLTLIGKVEYINSRLEGMVQELNTELTEQSDATNVVISTLIEEVNAAISELSGSTEGIADVLAAVEAIKLLVDAAASQAATNATAAATSAANAATAGANAGTIAGTSAGNTAGTAAGTTAGTSAGTTAGTAAANAALTAQKNVNNGIAGLDASARVLQAQLPMHLTTAAIADKITAASLFGTYAARPAANTVPAGTIYYATNVPESYRSNGTAWSVINSGGNEIGAAVITAAVTTVATSRADVAGLTSTFIVGERPIKIEFTGLLNNNTASAVTVVYILLDDVVVTQLSMSPATVNKDITLTHSFRKAGLVPGTSHVAKIQMAVSAGTGNMGSAFTPSMLSVNTL